MLSLSFGGYLKAPCKSPPFQVRQLLEDLPTGYHHNVTGPNQGPMAAHGPLPVCRTLHASTSTVLGELKKKNNRPMIPFFHSLVDGGEIMAYFAHVHT